MGSPGIGLVRLCVQLHHKLTRAATAGVLQTTHSSATAGGHHHQTCTWTHIHLPHPLLTPSPSPRSCPEVLRSKPSDGVLAIHLPFPLLRPHRLSQPQPVAWAFSIMMPPTRIRDPVCLGFGAPLLCSLLARPWQESRLVAGSACQDRDCCPAWLGVITVVCLVSKSCALDLSPSDARRRNVSPSPNCI